MVMVMAEQMIRRVVSTTTDRPMRRRRRRKDAMIGRSVVALLLAALGWISVSSTLARVVAHGDIDAGYKLASTNAQIAGRLALSLFQRNGGRGDLVRARLLARAALRRDATVVPAVVLLGLDADMSGNRNRAHRLFSYSERLSRRDLTTQMWALEDAVGRGDISGALRHYDIALRTSPESGDLLFPVLAAASADAPVRGQLVRLLASEPPWGAPFISYVASNGKQPLVNAMLLLEAGRAGFAVPASARAAVVTALTHAGYADQAWAFYSGGRRLDRRRSRDPAFTGDTSAPTPLDWMSVENPGISASIQRTGTGGVFEFSAPASVGGSVLQQLQLLPPGRYRLTGHGAGISQPSGERPFWSITCHDGREFGRVEFPDLARTRGQFAGFFDIPAGCGIQMLQLLLRPVSATAGISAQIDRVQVEPVT